MAVLSPFFAAALLTSAVVLRYSVHRIGSESAWLNGTIAAFGGLPVGLALFFVAVWAG
ncbi:hypothetical protein [Streptomyces lushanensis]|uniref:hypothetical protein n=1 Tax=Streptomyces lushanensis TaxID=1434255 RepID=UPI00147404AA|nr:hypothetical protein [Streptomyces lushanensis]